MDVKKAEEILGQSQTAKGFRKPSKKQIKQAEEALKNDRQTRADGFLKEYTEEIVCEECGHKREGLQKRYGIEFVAEVQKIQGQNLLKPVVMLGNHNPNPGGNVKPWSEAMGENLDNRKKCEHKLHEEGNVCEKCGLNPENWGHGDLGVKPEYEEKMLQKIADAQAEEIAEANKEEETKK